MTFLFGKAGHLRETNSTSEHGIWDSLKLFTQATLIPFKVNEGGDLLDFLLFFFLSFFHLSVTTEAQ